MFYVIVPKLPDWKTEKFTRTQLWHTDTFYIYHYYCARAKKNKLGYEMDYFLQKMGDA